MSRIMTSADWCCICGNTPCDGLDCGAYLIGQTPRKKPEPKPQYTFVANKDGTIQSTMSIRQLIDRNAKRRRR